MKELIDQAREVFHNQVGKGGGFSDSMLLAAFNNAITPLVAEMQAMEQALLDHNFFRCNRCEAWTSPDQGGDDDMPGVCDECWSRLHDR